MNDGQDIGQDKDRTPESSPVLPLDEKPAAEEPLLTVAEAARRLGVDPKQIRRYADKLTGQDRTPARQSPVRVRLSAVQALRDGTKSEAVGEKDSGQDKDRTRQDMPDESVLPARSEGTLDALVYQQRITDLEAMNAELKADKERLYGLLETAQANLAREQTLRALPAPQAPVPEASNGRAGDATQGETDLLGVQVPPKPNAGRSEGFSASGSNDVGSADQESEAAAVTVDGNKKRAWWRLWN